ncbi:MAG: DUF2183 domain-containing protein [Chitinophagales bacterium]|nr:DUF2183 domain-containing protein [Chitinophagales bacterium]
MLLNWLRLSNEVAIKVYNGYGNTEHVTILGHVLSLWPLPRKNYRQNLFVNFFSLIRLFIVRPVNGATLRIYANGEYISTRSDPEGFFKLEWKPAQPFSFGWHNVKVELINMPDTVITSGSGSLFVPHPTQAGFISDIDDTFLVSHSSNLRKRLSVLFTNNARSRKPFEEVVNHYKALMHAQTESGVPNPFFYVSSSEWNLYDYLVEFHRVNGFPEGVFLLNQLKVFNQILKTGQNNHATKFTRIVRILEAFPQQKFVLLGDSSQHDTEIYASIAYHFPGKIRAVYIRDVYQKNREKVQSALSELEQSGVHCFLYQHSSEAILHSKKIGLIN